jgi:putative transposase
MEAKCKPYSRLLRKGRYSQLGRCYLITAVTHGRLQFFSDFYSARCLISVFMDLHLNQQVIIKAFVVMPDHFHCLLVLSQTDSLSNVVRQIKGRSARLINISRSESGKLWQEGFHDHGLRDGEKLDEYIDYILANPLRKGLVDDLSEYSHWDVIDEGYFDRG